MIEVAMKTNDKSPLAGSLLPKHTHPVKALGSALTFEMLLIVALVLAPLLLPMPAFAQEQAVVPITKLQIYGPGLGGVKFGTGFCMDADCRYIGTNYHVAEMMGNLPKIEGDPVVAKWLASGPADEGATENKNVGMLGRLMLGEKYAQVHDFALIELLHPLSRKGYHGLPFYDDNELQPGQAVTIYSFPLRWNPKRKLESSKAIFVGYDVKYATHELEDLSDKMLLFKYSDGNMAGGASGGIVVDAQGRIVGVLNAIALNSDRTVSAVPMPSVSAFVSRVQPYLSAQIFPKSVFISPVAADRYPEWVPPAPPAGELEYRRPEPPDVALLRDKAQNLVENLYTMIAVQSFEWGKDSAANAPQALGWYEVRMFNGYQHYREYPDGKKEMSDMPLPPLNYVVGSGDAWISTPKMVAKDFDLKIRRADDIVVDGQTVRVFQYVGKKEDKVCNFDDELDLGFATLHRLRSYDCYGEVWTDQDENVLRMSLNFPMMGAWTEYREVVTFGWVEIKGVQSLVPITISSEAKEKSHTYWCRGMFTSYQQFRSTARLLLTDNHKQH